MAVATLGSSLGWRERAFLMGIAPRGIVVAAVSAEFSLALDHSGIGGGQQLVGLVFPAIVLTVLVYGFGALPLGRLLGVAQADPQGVLIVGADAVGRALGHALQEQGVEVMLVDTNHTNTTAARTSGLRTWQGSVLSQRFVEDADLAGLGRMLALTPSAEVNRLALEQFVPVFGRANLYRLSVPGRTRREEIVGRVLFHDELGIDYLRDALHGGARIRATKLTEQFGPQEYEQQYGDRARPLFVVTDGKLEVVTTSSPVTLKAGTTVLALVAEGDEGPAAE